VGRLEVNGKARKALAMNDKTLVAMPKSYTLGLTPAFFGD
jgi:hypothetical protein